MPKRLNHLLTISNYMRASLYVSLILLSSLVMTEIASAKCNYREIDKVEPMLDAAKSLLMAKKMQDYFAKLDEAETVSRNADCFDFVYMAQSKRARGYLEVGNFDGVIRQFKLSCESAHKVRENDIRRILEVECRTFLLPFLIRQSHFGEAEGVIREMKGMNLTDTERLQASGLLENMMIEAANHTRSDQVSAYRKAIQGLLLK